MSEDPKRNEIDEFTKTLTAEIAINLYSKRNSLNLAQGSAMNEVGVFYNYLCLLIADEMSGDKKNNISFSFRLNEFQYIIDVKKAINAIEKSYDKYREDFLKLQNKADIENFVNGRYADYVVSALHHCGVYGDNYDDPYKPNTHNIGPFAMKKEDHQFRNMYGVMMKNCMHDLLQAYNAMKERQI